MPALGPDRGGNAVRMLGRQAGNLFGIDLTPGRDNDVADTGLVHQRHDRRTVDELIDLAVGVDQGKLIGLGAVAMVLGVSAAIAAGGQIDRSDLRFDADLSQEEQASAVANLIEANTGEASMMARCTGKTDLHNIEPEDLRALTLATAEATGLPVAGMRRLT